MDTKYFVILMMLMAGVLLLNVEYTQAQNKENMVTPDNPSIPLDDYLRRVPGVIIMNQGGQTRVMLRGSTTLSGNNAPLFVLDGYYLSTFEDLEKSVEVIDIAEINVLKGTRASDRYGLRASNGAIVIKTKTHNN